MALDSNRTLEKGIEMLFQFTEQNPIRSVKDIVAELDLPRSTAYRLLDTLKNKKMIQEHGNGRYRLGLSILQLAKIATVGMDLVNLALPVMEKLSEETEETVILSGLMNDHAICIDRIESTQPIKLAFERGRVQPLHKGASAKILLAYLDEKRQQGIIESLHQQGKIEDKLLFQQSLADIKEQGYVITSEEIDPGAWAIAAPIFGASNEILAGISIAGPKYRIDSAKEQTIIQQLLPNAEKLNEQMKLLGIDCI